MSLPHLGVLVECLLLLLLSLVAEFPHHRQQPLVLLLQILYVPEGGSGTILTLMSAVT